MVSTAYAAGAAPGAGYESILMLVVMFAIFYFLLIRPQQKKAKQHRALLDSLQVGTQVVTAGGIHGKVAALQESVVTLEVATGVKVKFNRSSIVATVQE